MSFWTHITGMIKVEPDGQTQPEMRYNLETILEHLPPVTGSEQDMEYYVIQKMGYSSLSNCDENGRCTNLAKIDGCGGIKHSRNNGLFKLQNHYFIIVDGDFRDRTFKTTFKEFNKWLNRLAKRCCVSEVLVNLSDCNKQYTFTNKNETYTDMYGWPLDEQGVNKNGRQYF